MKSRQKDQDFQNAVALVLDHEGGYVDDSLDPGGKTKYGISSRSYPQINIATLTLTQAEEIYHKDFWLPSKAYKLNSQLLQQLVFDFAVNSGVQRSVKTLQNASNGVSSGKELRVDGDLGPITARKLNRFIKTHTDSALAFAFTTYRSYFYLSLGNKRFVKGWLNRAFALL